jgi:hypothetical protein
MEKRRLKQDVETFGHKEERTADHFKKVDQLIESLTSQGLHPAWAGYIAVRSQELQHPRQPIAAGQVVQTSVAAYWGNPADDPNPLLLVESADGRLGLCTQDMTEAA